MFNFEKEVPFDPGYNKILIPFMPLYESGMEEIKMIKNFNQKKLKYKLLLTRFDASLKNTLGFFKGCLLWAIYIKYKFQNDPKEISGNGFLNAKKEELNEYFFEHEFNLIENYMKNYSKNVKYYTGENAELEGNCLDILNDYKEFIRLNDNFLNTKRTTDIRLPEKFLKEYSEKELEKIYNEITENIFKQDLSLFL